jgi:hypothetical protein
MLSYHPALDPYHTALRILQVFTYDTSRKLYKHDVRIIDFYMLFPELIKNIRTTKEHMYEKKRISPDENKYFTPKKPESVFGKMEEIHDAAFNMLLTTGIIKRDQDKYIISDDVSGYSIVEMAKSKNKDKEDVLSLLMSLEREVPSVGEDSLKDRSGLDEYRYDPV